MKPIQDDPNRRTLLAALGFGVASLPLATWPAKSGTATSRSSTLEETHRMTTRYATKQVGEVDVFYREAGPRDAPVLLLLHGFPTASHMFRDLILLLADRYRVIAPDLPGFGNTVAPPRAKFEYSFDRLADVVEGFVDAMGLSRYSLYIFDYGAPTGLRLAMRHPERVSAIISQNGNAYVEGFSKEWVPWQAYWRDPSPVTREACRAALSDAAIEVQYRQGAPGGGGSGGNQRSEPDKGTSKQN